MIMLFLINPLVARPRAGSAAFAVGLLACSAPGRHQRDAVLPEGDGGVVAFVPPDCGPGPDFDAGTPQGWSAACAEEHSRERVFILMDGMDRMDAEYEMTVELASDSVIVFTSPNEPEGQ